MSILTAVAAGIASFFVAVVMAFKIQDAFADRWTDRRINVVSVDFCFVFTGSPAYTMAAFDVFSLVITVAIHLGVGCAFAAIVLFGMLNYVEGFVLAIIFCILISILVPALQKVRERRAQTTAYLSSKTARPQSGVTFGVASSLLGQ